MLTKSSPVITVTGDGEIAPSRSIREPVTSIRSTFYTFSSSAANELAEKAAVEAAPKAIAKRTAFETLLFIMSISLIYYYIYT